LIAPRVAATLLVLLAGTQGSVAPAQTGLPSDGGWVEVDYSALVDRRQLSHSGESVGELLRRLGGRPLPGPGENRSDRLAHSLLDPMIEPYALVLPDVLDSLEKPAGRPFVEIGRLWHAGVEQPGWVELLRARRYLVESDGAGRLRMFLPDESGTDGDDSASAALGAWSSARPILRHLLRAERQRLGAGAAELPSLAVSVYPYRHLPARSLFSLGSIPHRETVDDTRPGGRRPPLDLAAWSAFLDSGLQLEGARLEADGSIRLLGSKSERPSTLLGRPLSLADFAVAYRAVVHGGQAEPYMSLDRGFSPQMSIVNYGGRLRDTAMGWVSLQCDILFKTFSLGLDIVRGMDRRAEVVAAVPNFLTHIERLARDPGSEGIQGQGTRLWFYPDSVDLTISTEGDVLVLRKVRMSAASQRVDHATGSDTPGEDPPWTRATIAEINRDYDSLANFFPELHDLDQVVRLLSLFTWLEQARAEGLLLPELDALLALELPQLPTPRVFPQLLAFNALPEAGSMSAVDVFDRVEIGEALERLNGAPGPVLGASRRFERAAAWLNPDDAQAAALIQRFQGVDAATAAESSLDRLAHQAERLRMHQTVLATLPAHARSSLQQRVNGGERLRPFSLGIGGIDLGMDSAVERARAKSLELSGFGGDAADGSAAGPSRVPSEARDAWRQDPPGLAVASIPDHGLGSEIGLPAVREFGDHRIEIRDLPDEDRLRSSVWTLLDRDGLDVTSRKIFLDASGKAVMFERVESGRLVRYRFEGQGKKRVARPVLSAAEVRLDERAVVDADLSKLPSGLALFRAGEQLAVGSTARFESRRVRLRMDATVEGAPQTLHADIPRNVLQRLLLGPAADLARGRPLPGLSPLPEPLGKVDVLMVLLNPPRYAPPWSELSVPVPGEEDPARLARAMNVWWAAETGPTRAVVGTDPRNSPFGWSNAPRPGNDAVLWLPGDGFPGPAARLRDGMRRAWRAGPVVSAFPSDAATSLIVLVSGEAPDRLAARLRSLARDPAMSGKLLAVWPLAGDLRPDLPASLLGEGRLAGLGMADRSVVGQRDAAGALSRMSAALSGSTRVEGLPGPFLWFF